MSLRDDRARLQHMLAHTEEAIAMATGRSRADLDVDLMLNLSLVRLLEIVGEAAARVSDPCQQRLRYVPWPQIVSPRNRLIHGYDEVDFDILWDIIQIDLPPLAKSLQGYLRNAERAGES